MEGVGHRQLERGGQHRSLAHHQVHEVAPLPALLPHPPRLVPLPLLEELPVAEYPLVLEGKIDLGVPPETHLPGPTLDDAFLLGAGVFPPYGKGDLQK